MATSPSWYDILGVRRDATPAEIKAAWREATDKFEPGSGSSHFRLFNEAADVLLDPGRRAAYDAQLAEQEAAATADAPTDAPTDATVADEPTRTPLGPEPTATGGRTDRPAPREPAGWLRFVVLVLLPVLTLAAVAVAGYFGYHAHRDGLVEDARTEAPAAAERALESVLAYDYRHLGADEQRAARFLTPRYKRQKHFAATWGLLAKGKDGKPGPAVSTKTVVTAHAVGSAVVDAAPDLARVLVFLNQTSEKAGKNPVIFQNRVVVTMVRSGNTWLIDDLRSY